MESKVSLLRCNVERALVRYVIDGKIDKRWLYFMLDDIDTVPQDLGPLLQIPVFDTDNISTQMKCTIVSLCILFKKRTMFCNLFQDNFRTERRLYRQHRYDSSWLWYHLDTPRILTEFLQQSNPYTLHLLCRVQAIMHPFISNLSTTHSTLFGANPNLLRTLCTFKIPHTSTRLAPILSPELMTVLDPNDVDTKLYKYCFNYIMTKLPPFIGFTTPIHKRWIRSSTMSQFLGFMERKVHSYMMRLHSRCHRLKASRKVVPQNRGYAYLVPQKNIWWVSLSKEHILASFTSENRETGEINQHRSIVSASEAQTLSNIQSCVFLTRGTYIDPDKFPRQLCAHLKKYGGRVPKLNFQRYGFDSTGLILNPDALQVMRIENRDRVVDITSILEIKTVRKRRRKPLPSPIFAARMHLNQDELERFSAQWPSWSIPQRKVFCLIFWFIGKVDIAFVSKSLPMLTFVKELITELALNSTYRSAMTKIKAHLWNKLKPLCGHLCKKAKAWILMNNYQDTCLINCLLECLLEPALFVFVYKTIVNEKLVVGSNIDIYKSYGQMILTGAGWPPRLRRLIYHSMNWASLHTPFLNWHESQSDIVSVPDALLDVPQLKILLLFIPSPANSVIKLVFDRHSKRFQNISSVRQLCSSMVTKATIFDVKIRNEPGYGPAVFSEVLQIKWSHMIELKALTSYDDSGLCFCARGDFSVDEHKISDMCFELGLISALCVERGLYLPLPLATDFWAFLKLEIDDEEKCLRYEKVFTKVVRMWESVRDLDAKSFAGTFGLPESECKTVQSRKDYIYDGYQPCATMLTSFYSGWDSIICRSKFKCLAGDLNAIFCEPKVTLNYTYRDFRETFQVTNEKDDEFLTTVRNFNTVQLKILVAFITGKKRLPLLDLGEPPITVVWQGDGCLPRAQNCMNTIILPGYVWDMKECLNVIFQYETVFGLE